MSLAIASTNVGDLLRDWRQRRRLSQLDLAVDAEVSTRHLSFVETGRSKPSRELVLHLAEALEVPLRERNALLLAAGYAPTYNERPLEAEEMAPVREAIDKILAGHEPFPAVVVDRQWNLAAANGPALTVLTEGVAPELLEPPVNALRVSLHPDGMAARIANLPEWRAHLLIRLQRQATAAGDPQLFALYDELAAYPGGDGSAIGPTDIGSLLFIPLVLRMPDGRELSFFSTLATFGTALDITVAELAIESFFPADEASAAALRELSGS